MPFRHKFFFVVLCCFNLISWVNAQEDKQIQEPVDGLRLHVFRAIPFGNNMLGRSHEASYLGWEASISLPLVPELFEIGIGYQLCVFEKTDDRLFGKANRTAQHFFFLQLQHSFYKYKAWRVEANLGGGILNLNPMGEDSRIKGTWGGAAKTGVSGFYRVSKVVSFFATTQYVLGFNSIDAPSEFNAYFNRTHQLQLALGIFIN